MTWYRSERKERKDDGDGGGGDGREKRAIEIAGSKLSESFYRDEIGEARNGNGRLTRVSADRSII